MCWPRYGQILYGAVLLSALKRNPHGQGLRAGVQLYGAVLLSALKRLGCERCMCFSSLSWAVSVYIIRQRAAKFTSNVDAGFGAEGIVIVRTPLRAPKANAFAARGYRSLYAHFRGMGGVVWRGWLRPGSAESAPKCQLKHQPAHEFVVRSYCFSLAPFSFGYSLATWSTIKPRI